MFWNPFILIAIYAILVSIFRGAICFFKSKSLSGSHLINKLCGGERNPANYNVQWTSLLEKASKYAKLPSRYSHC